MKNILMVELKYIIIMTASVVVCMLQIGLDNFFGNLASSVIYLFGGYIFTFFITHWSISLLYMVLGRLCNLKTAALNLYPFFIIFNKVKFSINFFNYVKVKNVYSLNDVSLENIKSFKTLKEKAEKELELIELCSAVLFLILGLVLNISFFVMLFAMLYSTYVMRRGFDKIEIFAKDKNILIDELVFSKQAPNEIYEYHLHYLLENIVSYMNKYEKLNSINLLLFAYFNNPNTNKESLKELDKAVFQLMQKYRDEIGITCRDILFDYVDNRIVLGVYEDEKELLLNFLELYITVDWGIKLPKITLKRVKKLKMYLEGNSDTITFQRGKEIYLF